MFKKFVSGLVIAALFTSTSSTAFAVDKVQNFLKLIGGNSINAVRSAYTLGNNSNPWTAIYATDAYFTNLAVSAVTTGSVDLNGNSLIIDADADTYLEASTDDQVNMHIGSGGKETWLFNGVAGATMDVDTVTLTQDLDVQGTGAFAQILGLLQGLKFTGATSIDSTQHEIKQTANGIHVGVPTGKDVRFNVDVATVGTVDVNGFNGVLGGTTPAAGTFTGITTQGLTKYTAGAANVAGGYACGRNNDATNRLQCDFPSGSVFEFSSNDTEASNIDEYGAYVFKRTGQSVATNASKYALFRDSSNDLILNTGGANFIGFYRNGTLMSSWGPGGQALNGSIYSSTGIANAEVAFATTGTTIRRNVADSNATLTVTSTNAGATGSITNFSNSSGVATSVSPAGALVFAQDSTLVNTNHELRRTSAGLFMQAPSGKQVGMLSGSSGFTVTNAIYTSVPLSNSASTNNATVTMATTGTQIARNVADSNPALLVTQTHASSTGNLATFANSSGVATSFGVNGALIFSQTSAVTAANSEIRRTTSGININAVSTKAVLLGVNGGTTLTVGDGSLAYTATANEYFNITANNHTGIDGGIFLALGSSAAEVRGISVENTLNGDYTDTRNFDGYLAGPSAGLTGQAAVYWGEIENSANDAAGSIYSVFRAIDVTDNGGDAVTAVVHGGDNYDFFAVLSSGSIFAIDNATFGITAQNGGDSDRNGYDMPFVAESGTDSGAVARNGGSFTFKPGDQVNGGDVGTFKIVEAGAGSNYWEGYHDGTDFHYNNPTGIHVFEQVVRAKSGLRHRISTADVSNPPTDAELDAEFGTPATVGSGFTAVINDNGGGANFYQVTSDGTNWWVFTGTLAT